jgi:tRNA A-37 threonylcarbamoyl transferase component Bud32
MSTVFRGRDLVLGREVAIKMFAASAADNGELRAQQREARLLAASAHHSIVRLFDVGVDFLPDGTPRMYLVTELVDGTDLRVRLRAGRLPLRHVAHIAYDLAEGLAFLHANGVIHRDVKPANVLLVRGSEARRPRVKLTDFGIALRDERRVGLREEETLGTAAYLSPEQAAGEDITAATDVYALGLVLLESLTGRVAFPGGIVESAMARLDRDPLVPDQLPPAWIELLTAMTRRRPQDRPTAAAAADAFRELVVRALDDADAGRGSDAVSRLAAVRRYAVLAPGEDPDLEQLCALAQQLLRVDGAVIAIADEDRVYVRARSGSPLLTAAERDYVDGVLEEVPVLLSDLRSVPGPRPPLLSGETAGAYASAPLSTHDGASIGVLAVRSRDPRAFDDDDIATLQDIADMAMHEIELRRAVRRLLVNRFPGATAT